MMKVRENFVGNVLASLSTMLWNIPSKAWSGGAVMADSSLNWRMTVRLGPAVAFAQIGIVGFDGLIELEALRLNGLPGEAPALLCATPALPVGTREFLVCASFGRRSCSTCPRSHRAYRIWSTSRSPAAEWMGSDRPIGAIGFGVTTSLRAQTRLPILPLGRTSSRLMSGQGKCGLHSARATLTRRNPPEFRWSCSACFPTAAHRCTGAWASRSVG